VIASSTSVPGAANEVHRPPTAQARIHPNQPTLGDLGRIEAQKVRHHELQQIDASSVEIIDALTSAPARDLRGIDTEELSQASLRAEVTTQRGYFLFR
jgi:hypothetical protein